MYYQVPYHTLATALVSLIFGTHVSPFYPSYSCTIFSVHCLLRFLKFVRMLVLVHTVYVLPHRTTGQSLSYLVVRFLTSGTSYFLFQS